MKSQRSVFQKGTRVGVTTNVYSRKTLEKPKRGLRILKRRVRELFMHREGISTSHAYHKGRQPLIKCAKHDFKIMYFPFVCFFIFLGSTRGCPCSYVSLGVMRNSYLRSSLSQNICVLNSFYAFERFILVADKESFKALDLETISSNI